MKDATKIIIAQRISSVRDADLILVLDEGKISGRGTHDELLEHCTAYREIYLTQAGERQQEETDTKEQPNAAGSLAEEAAK